MKYPIVSNTLYKLGLFWIVSVFFLKSTTIVAQDASQTAGTPPSQLMSSASAPGASGSVGGVSGSATVSPFNGSLVQSYPFEVLPGRGAETPQIGLIYNSSAGNGNCGVGWSLDVPRIERVGKNNAIPKYDNTDEFILHFSGSAQKLVEVGNNQYRTNKEAFLNISRIIDSLQFGILTWTFYVRYIKSWQIKDNNGTTYRLTRGEDFNLFTSNYNHIWILDEVEDFLGNYAKYHYIDGSQRNGSTPIKILNKVEYGGNRINPSAHLYSVQLNWENRSDTIISFRNSCFEQLHKRLKAVTVLNGTEMLWKYQLSYDLSPITYRSRLKSIIRQNADNMNVQPSTQFTYNERNENRWQTETWNFYDENGNLMTTGFPAFLKIWIQSNTYYTYDLGARFLDVNNDGLPDVVVSISGHRPNSLAGTSVYLNMKKHGINGWKKQPASHNPPIPFVEIMSSKQGGQHIYHSVDLGVRFGDINGDGWLDIVQFRTSHNVGEDIPSQRRIYFGKPNGGWDSSGAWKWLNSFPEIPGGRWGNFVWIHRYPGQNDDYSYHVIPQGVELMDVNNDGCADIVYGGLHRRDHDDFMQGVYLSNGVDGWSAVNLSWTVPNMLSDLETVGGQDKYTPQGVSFGDFNGDGLVDVIEGYRYAPNSSNFHQNIFFNRGNRFDTRHVNQSLNIGRTFPQTDPHLFFLERYEVGVYDKGLQVVDINADGISDLIQSNPFGLGTRRGFINNGSSWTRRTDSLGIMPELFVDYDLRPGASSVSPGDIVNTGVFFADVNGDGRIDLVKSRSNDNTPRNPVVYLNPLTEQPDLLKQILSPEGATTEITYKSSTYCDSTSIPAVFQVVDKLQTWNGTLLNGTGIKYDFSNGKWDYNERTFIGFGKVRTIPLNNAGGSGIGETVTYYHQSNDKAGKPYRTEIYAQGASSPISVSEITYQNDGSAPYFTPITKQVSMQDGISTTVEFEQFDANNGQPKRTIQKNVPVYENGITTYKDRVVENAFAYEQNGALATEHRYSEISEVKTRDSDGNLLSHKKTIYTSQNATEKFLPNEEQIWDKDRNQWITVSKIVKRDNFGTPIETQDIDGISSSTILGHKGRFPIASFGNAAHHEVFADDFNDGSLWDSDPTTWTTAGEWQASNGTANARTSGARMLYAPTQTPPQSLLQNFIAEFDFKINTAGSAQDWCGFVFRGNTNVAQGFDISGGYLVYFRQNGSVEVMPSNGNMVSTYSPKSIVRGTAMWNRAKLLVQGNVLTIFVNGEFFYSLALGGANVGTTFGFEGHGANFEIDNFRLYPANAFASSQSINPKTLLTEHATDAQGVRSFTEYDEFRVPIETRNNEGLVMSTRYYSFSRETNGNYNPSTPNTSTSLSYQYGNPILNASFETRDSVGKAMWDTYPYRSPKHWTWEYNLYAANYYGDGVTGKGYMYLRASQNNGYVHTFLSKPDYLKGSTTYKISFWAKSNPYGQSTSPMKIYLMKVGLDSAYQVWAFSSLQIGTTWQKYTLTLSTNADPKWNNPQYLSVFRFDVDRMYDIVYLDDVQIEEEGKSLNASLTKSFSDGLGRTLQTQAFDASSNQWIVSAQHDDSFGRPTRAYRPFEANTNGAFTITIPSNQGYTETTYYNDPLSRTKDQKPIGATGGASTSINEWVTTEYGAEGNLRVTSTHSPYDNTGRTVSKAYTDAYGRAIKTITNVSESGALKLFTETDYDIQDRPTRTIDPNGFTDVGARNGQFQSTMHYDFLGNMKSKTSPDAGTAEYIYDRAGRLRFSRNAKQAALNQFSYFAYDNLGKLIEEGYGYHNPSDWNINSYSSVLQQLADNSKSWPRELNPATWRKRYIYDEIGTTPFAKGALVRVETNNDDNADSDVIEQYQYDQYGRTTEKAIQVLDYNDQPKTTRYVYDDAGQVRRVIYPTITSSGGVPSERTVTAFSFSGAHTVEAQDSLRTSGAVKAESGSQVMFRAGKRIRLQSGFHAKAGTRFRAKIEPPSASGSGMEITYAYNNLGELIAIGNGGDADYFARYTYNSDGGLAEEWLNNSTATFKRRFEYEAYRGRLTGISGSFFTQSVGYGAYLNGNIAATTYTYPNFSGLNNAYSAITYDRLGRLKKADNVQNAYDVGAINELTYDKNGNIVRLQRGTGGTVNYVYQAGTNKVTSLTSGKTYQYDAVGNITRSSDKAAQGIGYDPFTQMTTEVKPSAAERVGFKYDSANERVMKLWENKSVMPAEMEATLYLHGLSDYPLSEKIDDGNRVYERQYVYGLQGLICVVEGGSETYIFKDHLGSTRAAIDKTGAFGEGYAYDALGKRIGTARFGIGTANYPRYFYTGQEYDEETGLYNFRARLYDSELFRFYATDPAGQDFSPYTFVGNNPIIHIDPSGEWFFTALLPGVGTVIDAVLWGATWGAGAGAATYLGISAIFNQPITLSGFGQAVGLGALSGAFSGGLSLLGGQLGSFGTSLTYSLLSNAGTYAATTALTGGQLDLPGLLGSIGGATIGAIFPPFQASSNNPFESIFTELAYGAFKGSVVGGFSSGITSAFRGQDPVAGFVQGFKYGAASGGISTALNIGLWGYAKPYNKTSLDRIAQAEEYYGVKLGQNLPTLRSGGASRLFSNRGFSWFDSSILNADGNDTEIAAHEGTHAVQRAKLGWFNFYKKLSGEQGLLRSINVYSIKGYYEYDAQRIGKGLKP